MGGGIGESHKEEGPGYDQNKEGAKRYLVLFYKLGFFPFIEMYLLFSG